MHKTCVSNLSHEYTRLVKIHSEHPAEVACVDDVLFSVYPIVLVTCHMLPIGVGITCHMNTQDLC